MTLCFIWKVVHSFIWGLLPSRAPSSILIIIFYDCVGMKMNIIQAGFVFMYSLLLHPFSFLILKERKMKTFLWTSKSIMDSEHKNTTDPHPRGRQLGWINQVHLRNTTHVVSLPQVKAFTAHSRHSFVMDSLAESSCFWGAHLGENPLILSSIPSLPYCWIPF